MVRRIMVAELASEELASRQSAFVGPVNLVDRLGDTPEACLAQGDGIGVDHTIPGRIVCTRCEAESSRRQHTHATPNITRQQPTKSAGSNSASDHKGKGVAQDVDDSVTMDGDDSTDEDGFNADLEQAIHNSLLPQSDTCASDGALAASINNNGSSSSSRYPAIQPSTNSHPKKAAHANAKKKAREISQREKDARYRAKIIFNLLKKVVATQVDDDDNKGKAADDDDDDNRKNWSPPDGVGNDNDDDDDDDDAAAVSATTAEQDMQRFGAEVAEVLKSAKKKTFYQDALSLMYRLIIRLRDLGGNPVTLVPLYHASAGYITIDTRGRYYILNDLAKTSDIECPETNVTNFEQHRLQHWPEKITIPRKLFLQPGKTVVGHKTYFRNSLSTDCVGASLFTRRWESFPNAPKERESVKKRATRLANAAAEAARAAAAAARGWTADHLDREFVGIDPGRKSIMVARRLRDPNWRYSLSTDAYYERCGINDDRDADADEIDRIKGLRQWMSKIPTAKTATSQETLKRLRYLYRSPYFRDMMETNIDFKRRIRRWVTYKRKRSFIAEVCHRLTEGLEKHKATICFGDGGFPNSSSGHRASISMQPFIEFLRREGWHVIVVSETNTSQVCSHCCRQLEDDYLPYKMCDVGDAADGHAFYYKPSNNHFVRRCTRCHVIWDRDGNAARSIGYLGMLEYYKRQRPLCFIKRLQKPPAYDARRLAAQAAQAAERAAAAFDTETLTAPVDDADVPLSNSKQRRVERRVERCVTRKMGAKRSQDRQTQEVADILASPNEYVQRLVMARPGLDPEAEWAQAYERVTKGQKKQDEKKAASDKAKTKTKRTADSLTTEEPAPKRRAKTTTTGPKRRAKTTTTGPKRKAKTTTTPEGPVPKRNSRRRTTQEEPAPEEPASKKSKTKKDKNKKKD
ncbi:hypothetical protein GGF41_000531 [Coemansia sp. RSA 2531]|nr:hypothetical protein GGF41_000531 [Coemansia sp. RSA 2531]